MRLAATVAAAFVTLSAAGIAPAADPELVIGTERLLTPQILWHTEDGPRVTDRNGIVYKISITGGTLALDRRAGEMPPPADKMTDQLPGSTVSFGNRNIRRAWLAGPTDRYRHGVLGDAIEASAVIVENPEGRRFRLDLPPDTVFEDQIPRILDLDDDGRDELLLVLAKQDSGAAIAVVEFDGSALRLAATGPDFGRPNRWLNPIGAADVDGDGRTEIAYIATPHIGGVLNLFRYDGTALSRIAQTPGFSNHAIGAANLGWSAILDVTADGIPDLVIPARDRSLLRVMSFAGAQFSEPMAIRLPSDPSSDFLVTDLNDNNRPDLLIGLRDGSLAALLF
ncbi:MAG: VCBS repeat-containing protein [Rhodospirillales bacterium]